MIKEKETPELDLQTDSDVQKELVLFNDEVNSFDHVISSLIDVCGHTVEQAEQCALLAHFKGKCGVKNGSFNELFPLFVELGNRDLTVEIQ
ncbi:MAG: ATP-dependent Clp protease adaptor ClpS [Sphingobacteriia bacterium]|nr:ATP-dependent Clp protease adaptor ClpS [Sphingobacteriia bacterium]